MNNCYYLLYMETERVERLTPSLLAKAFRGGVDGEDSRSTAKRTKQGEEIIKAGRNHAECVDPVCVNT